MRKSVTSITMAAVAILSLGGCRSIFAIIHPSSRGANVLVDNRSEVQAAQQLVAGRQALEDGRFAAAITAFSAVRAVPGYEATAYNGLAIAYSNIGRALLFTQLMTEAIENKRYATELGRELELLVANTRQHGMFMLDAQGCVVIWNKGAQRLYGWTEAEMVGRHYGLCFIPADRDAGLPALQLEILRNGEELQCHGWRQHKDGRRFLAEVHGSRIDDDKGQLIGFAAVVRDITEEDHAAREIEAGEARLLSILETVPDAMITMDEHGIIESFSTTAERMFGYTADEVIGQNVSMIMPQPDAAQHDGYLARYLLTGERRIIGFSRRVMGRRKNGDIFPHEINVGEARIGDKRIFTGFLRDLTAREEADAKLQELQAELIHISRVSALGTMATALAHELNQPLTSIANYVQGSAALLASAEDVQLAMVRDALDQAGRESLRAGEIVHRLREFVARGELDRVIASPSDLVAQASAIGLTGARSNGIKAQIAIPPNLSPVLVDRIQIQQVLFNLFRNAVEALGQSGTISVDARQDGAMIRFSVRDNGPGITVGEEESVFDPYISSKQDGMGLGLAICRTIIAAHGGRLWCENVPGEGAAFHFTVPIAETDDG